MNPFKKGACHLLLLFVAGCSSLAVLTERTSVQAVLLGSRDVGERLDAEARERARQEGREPASKLRPSFQRPLRHFKVGSPFGQRSGSFHSGVDYRAQEGTPIYAAADGIVVYTGANIAGYGDTVIIRHIGNMATLYAHASYIGVEVGDAVTKGQFIAYAGESGNATGPHLHFEIRDAGKPVNPQTYFQRSKSKAR